MYFKSYKSIEFAIQQYLNDYYLRSEVKIRCQKNIHKDGTPSMEHLYHSHYVNPADSTAVSQKKTVLLLDVTFWLMIVTQAAVASGFILLTQQSPSVWVLLPAWVFWITSLCIVWTLRMFLARFKTCYTGVSEKLLARLPSYNILTSQLHGTTNPEQEAQQLEAKSKLWQLCLRKLSVP